MQNPAKNISIENACLEHENFSPALLYDRSPTTKSKNPSASSGDASGEQDFSEFRARAILVPNLK
jgi:hypothetical protein